ncbi:MAG: nucleotidyltransferase [Myxococcaceae bacterium]|nr:MAG: nucleotidyltransferase [Myxococcaceae bacterium]
MDEFIRALELSETRKAEVIAKHTEVRQALGGEVFLSGSYSRKTAIAPLHDVDMFAVRGEVDTSSQDIRGANGAVLTPAEVLKQVRQLLAAKWPEKELPLLQNHSVHIAFTTKDVEFDVVPAFRVRGRDVFRIPERETNRWIDSNPQKHGEQAQEANRRSGQQLNPLLKAVKQWNREHHSTPLRSFHLEAMSYSAFPVPPPEQGHLAPLKRLFEHLSRRVQVPCPDPAGLGLDVDANLKPSQREAARQVLSSAAEELGRVLAEELTAPEQAHRRLKKFFGSKYRDHD